MAWQKTSTQEMLENIQQNFIMPFHTVHDEIDLIIPNYIAEGVTTRIAYLASCRDIIDSFGSGYINYLADCEMDRKNYSWIPRGKDSLNPYAMPHSRHEKQAYEAMTQAAIEPRVVEFETTMSIADFRSSITYDPHGVFVRLKTPTKEVLSTKPIGVDSLRKYIPSL